ncbi:MAG: UDP-4-amino-4,6-dideoxy-N-acetyl-beta-L-altrosamine transaminase [bacterium]|nr:UDP-4-amino-4,6-dideoxy-N-acetyl-beta-L-altrosamine transaminase [bacterium]
MKPAQDTPTPLSYGKQWISEDDIAAVVEVLRSPWITQGKKVPEFERRVADYCGAKHAVAVSSGSAALHMAALATGLGPGDTGVTVPLTFVSSANCIAHTGAEVDFVDIAADTFCLDVDALAARCAGGSVPRVVVAVDFAGVPANLPSLFELAERYGFVLIEDAAHSLGSEYRLAGRDYRCGGCAHAHLATLSFHPVKAITCGEGGMVLTNDDHLAHRVRRLAGHGLERDPSRLSRNDSPWYHEMQELGFNYRLTDFQAALGLSQMDRLEQWARRRREIVQRYNQAFRDLADIPPWPENTLPAFHIYVLRVRGAWRDHRRLLFERLAQRGITPQVHYVPVHTQPYYQDRLGRRSGGFPVAEDTYYRCLTLPLYPSLTDADVSRVIAAVREILNQPPS